MINSIDIIKKGWALTPLLFKTLGCSIELTEKALIQNENIIEKKFPFGHKPLPTTLIPFSLHLGETIIANIPGSKWVNEMIDNPIDIRIEVPIFNKKEKEVIIIYPYNRVEKFWIFNRDYSLSCMLRTLKFIQNNDLNDSQFKYKADKDGWFKIPDGDLIRVTIIHKKDLPN